MDLPSKRVFECLLEKGISRLYHANSVLTACHFLRDGYLVSRGTVASLGIPQTPQQSDAADRRYSVWFDVFTDSSDIHRRASRKNSYGPVLFVLDIEKLMDETTGRIWITKRNPIYWAGLSVEQRWFQTIAEVEAEFTEGTFEQMIVFRHCGGRLPIRNALEKIILDNDADIECESPPAGLFPLACGALMLAMTEGKIDVPIEKRRCRRNCTCQQEYSDDPENAGIMFAPKEF